MPHFGVPFDPTTESHLTPGLFQFSGTGFPLTVAVDPSRSVSIIGGSLASVLIGGRTSGIIEFSLVTHNSPASLQLTNDAAHQSQPHPIRFMVEDDTEFPRGVAAIIGNDFVGMWTSRPWKLGFILSRNKLNCHPVT